MMDDFEEAPEADFGGDEWEKLKAAEMDRALREQWDEMCRQARESMEKARAALARWNASPPCRVRRGTIRLPPRQ